MKHYQTVLIAFVVLWLCGAGLAVCAAFQACEARAGLEKRLLEKRAASERASAAQREAENQELRMPALRKFLADWEPHLRRGADEREVGIAIRAGLEALAQQKLSLVTDQATTPEPGRILVGGKALRVQRVSLRASGESLSALVSWLGEAESSFPYARVEAWELAAAGGANCSLRAVFSQPLWSDSGEKKGGTVK